MDTRLSFGQNVALGHRFVLNCTNDCREYGPTSATGDQL
jgi:hypothetical protein